MLTLSTGVSSESGRSSAEGQCSFGSYLNMAIVARLHEIAKSIVYGFYLTLDRSYKKGERKIPHLAPLLSIVGEGVGG